MVLRALVHVALSPIRQFLGGLPLVAAIFVVGLPIIGIVAALGAGMDAIGVPSVARQAIGLVVGLGLLAAVVGAFGYYFVDW